MLAKLSEVADKRARGNFVKVQEMEGFTSPYNDLFWTICHLSVPFAFPIQNYHSPGARLEHAVHQHPLVMRAASVEGEANDIGSKS